MQKTHSAQIGQVQLGVFDSPWGQMIRRTDNGLGHCLTRRFRDSLPTHWRTFEPAGTPDGGGCQDLEGFEVPTGFRQVSQKQIKWVST